MGLGSDKETRKSPFVTAQRLICGPKLSLLLSFLTSPVEFPLHVVQSIPEVWVQLLGWQHRHHQGMIPKLSAHSQLSLHSAFLGHIPFEGEKVLGSSPEAKPSLPTQQNDYPNTSLPTQQNDYEKIL